MRTISPFGRAALGVIMMTMLSAPWARAEDTVIVGTVGIAFGQPLAALHRA